jgi:hypothetical protein
VDAVIIEKEFSIDEDLRSKNRISENEQNTNPKQCSPIRRSCTKRIGPHPRDVHIPIDYVTKLMVRKALDNRGEQIPLHFHARQRRPANEGRSALLEYCIDQVRHPRTYSWESLQFTTHLLIVSIDVIYSLKVYVIVSLERTNGEIVLPN